MLTLLALLACAQDPEAAKVTLDFKGLPIAKLLDALRTQTKVSIEVDEAAKKAVDVDKELVDLSVQEVPLTVVLQFVFRPHGLKVDVVDKKKIRIRKP